MLITGRSTKKNIAEELAPTILFGAWHCMETQNNGCRETNFMESFQIWSWKNAGEFKMDRNGIKLWKTVEKETQ